MIHGYLRLGDQTEAKEYFDEMQRRKLRPSAITWSVMVHSYARSDNDVNYNLASHARLAARFERGQQGVQAVVDGRAADASGCGRLVQGRDVDAPLARKGPSFAVLHTVLMAAQARRGEPEMVERTMERLASSTRPDGAPDDAAAGRLSPRGMTSNRLCCCSSRSTRWRSRRRASAATACMRTAHLARSRRRRAVEGKARLKAVTIRRLDANSRALLCMPISLMIDVLSTAGRHEEIARIWTRAKQDGFGFDASNWNHLAASMARAGQLEEALSVVERVLYHEPPRSWMHERAAADLKARNAKVAAEAESSKDWKSDEDEANDGHKSAADDGDEFDPQVAEDELDPASSIGRMRRACRRAHRTDATNRVRTTIPTRSFRGAPRHGR